MRLEELIRAFACQRRKRRRPTVSLERCQRTARTRLITGLVDERISVVDSYIEHLSGTRAYRLKIRSIKARGIGRIERLQRVNRPLARYGFGRQAKILRQRLQSLLVGGGHRFQLFEHVDEREHRRLFQRRVRTPDAPEPAHGLANVRSRLAPGFEGLRGAFDLCAVQCKLRPEPRQAVDRLRPAASFVATQRAKQLEERPETTLAAPPGDQPVNTTIDRPVHVGSHPLQDAAKQGHRHADQKPLHEPRLGNRDNEYPARDQKIVEAHASPHARYRITAPARERRRDQLIPRASQMRS